MFSFEMREKSGRCAIYYLRNTLGCVILFSLKLKSQKTSAEINWNSLMRIGPQIIYSGNDTSKKRTKLRRKTENDKKKLNDLVAEKNDLEKLVSRGQAKEVLVETLLSDDIPTCDVTFSVRKAAVDLHKKKKRLEEEEQLLIKEIVNLIKFYQLLIEKLEREVEQNCYMHECNIRGMLHYSIRHFPIMQQCMIGLKSLKKKGAGSGRHQLMKAIRMFSPILIGEAAVDLSSSDGSSSDDTDVE